MAPVPPLCDADVRRANADRTRLTERLTTAEDTTRAALFRRAAAALP